MEDMEINLAELYPDLVYNLENESPVFFFFYLNALTGHTDLLFAKKRTMKVISFLLFVCCFTVDKLF